MRLLFALATLALPLTASAQIATASPADGPYEAWSPLTMSPVGPLAGTPGLARWIDVRSSAGTTLVTFEPERRVQWRIVWGPHGPIEKRIDVDGETFSTSRFDYDAAGHLARKIADGPGLPGAPWVFEYTTDARGRVLTRRHLLAPGAPLARSRGLTAPALEEQRIVRRGATTVVTTLVDGHEVRRDRYDARGLLSDTRWTASPVPGTRVPFALAYRRDATGALVAIERTFGAVRSAADPRAPDPAVGPEAILAVTALPIERHEVALLLGAPRTSSDSGRGLARRITDDYSEQCWLNQPSSLEYDATGVLIGSHTQCICGF